MNGEHTSKPAHGTEEQHYEPWSEELVLKYPYLAAEQLRRYRAALEKIANGDPNEVYSHIGPLHAAGIALQWEIDAKIAREALGEKS